MYVKLLRVNICLRSSFEGFVVVLNTFEEFWLKIQWAPTILYPPVFLAAYDGSGSLWPSSDSREFLARMSPSVRNTGRKSVKTRCVAWKISMSDNEKRVTVQLLLLFLFRKEVLRNLQLCTACNCKPAEVI
jgi:hypothetical protein